jgi:hypothetical protein
MRKGKLLALAFCAGVASCAGPWAQATHVAIAAVGGSTISGSADVIEAVNCATHRCQPTGGSDIIVLVDGAKRTDMYDISLGTGSCGSPLAVRFIARFAGSDGGQGHTDVPIGALTSGKYVLIVTHSHRAGPGYGCGEIKSN